MEENRYYRDMNWSYQRKPGITKELPDEVYIQTHPDCLEPRDSLFTRKRDYPVEFPSIPAFDFYFASAFTKQGSEIENVSYREKTCPPH